MPNAVIWGASGGIGSALAEYLKAQGWDVAAVSRTAENVPDGVDASYEFDASDVQSIERAVYFIAQEMPEIDLMVYAVGDIAYEKLDRLAYEGWQLTLQSNLSGAFMVAQQSIPLLKQSGHMVFIGAYLEHLQLPKMGAYAVAKAGLEQLVNLLAKENRKLNFTLVRPGAVDTAFWDQVAIRKPQDAKSPQHVAAAILEHVTSGGSGSLDL